MYTYIKKKKNTFIYLYHIFKRIGSITYEFILSSPIFTISFYVLYLKYI